MLPTHDARADFGQCATTAGVLPDCDATTQSCCKKSFGAVSGANPLVITMDRCHQPGPWAAPPGAAAPRTELSFTWTKSGSTITATTSAAHGYGTNKDTYVKISGSSAFASGTYLVTAKSANTFQFTATTGVASCASSCGTVLFHSEGNGWCVDSPGTATRIGGSTSDDGMTRAYGLVYRLMQRGIPVYWLVNPTKTTIAISGTADAYVASDVDAWIVTSDTTNPPSSGAPLTSCTGACVQPVHRLNQSDLSVNSDSYQRKEFPIRGGAFLIAAEDRAKFDAFWKRTGTYASLATDTRYAWTTDPNSIDMYEIDSTAKIVHQNFTSGDGTSTSRFTTITGAPVAVKIDYEPPRVACLGCNSANPAKFLLKAGLNDSPTDPTSCLTGQFTPSDAVYCQLQESDVAAGTLVAGNFRWAWVFGFSSSFTCGTSAQKAVFDKLRDFMTTLPAVRNAGHAIFLNDAIDISESCGGKQMLGTQGSGTSYGLPRNTAATAEPYIIRYPTNLFMQTGDLPPAFAGGSVSSWDAYRSSASRYQTAFSTSGSTLRRLVSKDDSTLCYQHTSSAICDSGYGGTAVAANDATDLAAYARLGDVLVNGLAYYLPGNQLDTNGTGPELRMLLNSLIALPDETFAATYEDTEIARTQPTVASLDGSTDTVFVPTYVRRWAKDTTVTPARDIGPPPIPQATTTAGLTRFTYPYIEGHLRAIPASSYNKCTGASCLTSNTGRTTYSAMTNTFDAANGIPAANASGCGTNFAGTCRTVFTNTATGRLPTRVFFTDSDTNMNGTLGSLLTSNLTLTEKKTLVSRILKGWKLSDGTYVSRLGGINRSTPAVIGASNLVPRPSGKSSDRPTMVYFGATDGMMHAVCATVNTQYGCDVAGRELWAFIPRTLLPDLKLASAHIDGSPHVIDAYGNFYNTGYAWRTIMTFTTGTGSMTNNNSVPALYAIDITQPDDPKILWEYAVADVSARSSIEMGVATTVTAGPVLKSGVRYNYVFVQSSNGGTGGAGSVLTAVDVETGAKAWQKGDIYPTSGGGSGRNSAHESPPLGALPGGAVGFDKTGNNYITHIVYGTLYGDVYVRDAGTGANQNGSSSGIDVPLFRMSSDYKPIGTAPALYKDSSNRLYATFATGGYVDPQATGTNLSLWRGMNESTIPTQLAFAVNLNYSSGSSLTDTSTDTVNLPFKINFSSTADGSFAQPFVIGSELFFVTDTTNVNNYDYGSYSAPTGRMYRLDVGGTPTTWKSGTVQDASSQPYVVIAGGAASLFNSGGQLLTAGGAFGERTYIESNGSTGTAIDLKSTATMVSRRLWVRTE